MHASVAFGTECYQILLRIIAGLAAEFFVMDFKIGHCATRLASPAIATQHLAAESVVLARDRAAGAYVSVGLESRRLLNNEVHKFVPFFAGKKLEKP